MAEALKGFKGGVVVISHDFRLLSQVAQEIWVVDHGVKVWPGDIVTYKKHLVKKMGGMHAASAAAEKQKPAAAPAAADKKTAAAGAGKK